MTSLENKIKILAEIYKDYRNVPGVKDLKMYSDIAMPLSWLIVYGYASKDNDKGIEQIEDAWSKLLEAYRTEDIGFTEWEEIDKLGPCNLVIHWY